MASLALDKGAAALLSRHSPSDGLVAALRAVAANRKYLDSEVAQRLALARLDDRKTSVLAKLTRRELDVFLRLVQGRSPAVAAEQLGVSVKTVYGHRARIFQKLGAASLADLVLMAARHGVFAEKFEQETAGLANEANR